MRLATIMNKIKEFFKRIKELSNKDKLFIKIMAWLLVLQILFFTLDLAIYFKNKNNVANAEYSDLSSNTLVNFNQIASSTYYNTTLNLNQTTILSDTKSVVYHKYYIKVMGSSLLDNGLYLFSDDYNEAQPILYPFTNDTINDTIYNCLHSGLNFCYYDRNGCVINNVMIIDLTVMFGSESDNLTLEQAQEYFTADYYPYNTGTPIPYSKDYLQGYNDGANSVYEALTITYNDFTIGANSTSYGNNVIEKGEIIYDSNYGAYMFSGVIAIDLLKEIAAGTNININFDLYIPDLQGESGDYYKEFKLTFAYIDNSNNLTNIATIEPVKSTDVYENLYTGDIILPLTTRYLYIYVDYARVGQNEAPTQIFSYKSSMSFKSLDIGLIIKNSYLRGQQAGEQKYAYGTDGYNNIYNLGFAKGSNNSANGSIFTNGWSWVGMIFHEIGDILSIQLLPGIPISLFVALPLLVGLLFFIVKITKGSGG